MCFSKFIFLHKIKIPLDWYKLIAIRFNDAWRKRIFVNYEQYVYRYIWFNNSSFDNTARSDTIYNIRRQIVKCEFQQFRCTSWPLVPSRSHFQPSCTSLSTRQLVSLKPLSNFPYRNSRLVLETNDVSIYHNSDFSQAFCEWKTNNFFLKTICGARSYLPHSIKNIRYVCRLLLNPIYGDSHVSDEASTRTSSVRFASIVKKENSLSVTNEMRQTLWAILVRGWVVSLDLRASVCQR